jgi:hypothetical protein
MISHYAVISNILQKFLGTLRNGMVDIPAVIVPVE